MLVGLALAIMFQSKITSPPPRNSVGVFGANIWIQAVIGGGGGGEGRNRSLFSIAPGSSVNKQWMRKIFAATKN